MDSRIWHLGRALVGAPPTRRDGYSPLSARDTMPSVCYDTCDGAYKLAVSVGKSEKLCAEGSSFMGSYMSCVSCIEDNKSDPKKGLDSYVGEQFGQFIDYCEGLGVSTITSTSWVEVTPSAEVCSGCSTMVITDWEDNVVTLIMGTQTAARAASLDKATFGITKTVLQTVTVNDQATQTSAASEPDSSPGANLATIVGPVVPSVVLLIVLAIIGIFWYRRRQRKIKDQEAQIEVDQDAKVEKAQLHSDCVPRPTYELEGSVPVVPDGLPRGNSEMAANEVAAHEMSTDKKTGETRAEETRAGTGETNKVKQGQVEENKSEESKPEEAKPRDGEDDAGASK